MKIWHKTDLQALYLSWTYCHKTGTSTLAVEHLDHRLFIIWRGKGGKNLALLLLQFSLACHYLSMLVQLIFTKQSIYTCPSTFFGFLLVTKVDLKKSPLGQLEKKPRGRKRKCESVNNDISTTQEPGDESDWTVEFSSPLQSDSSPKKTTRSGRVSKPRPRDLDMVLQIFISSQHSVLFNITYAWYLPLPFSFLALASTVGIQIPN